jgi:hypothetical protein
MKGKKENPILLRPLRLPFAPLRETNEAPNIQQRVTKYDK